MGEERGRRGFPGWDTGPGARGEGEARVGTHKCEKQSGNSAGLDRAGPGGKNKSLIFIVRLLCLRPRHLVRLPSKEGMQPAGRVLLPSQEGWAIGEVRNHHLSIRGTVSSGCVTNNRVAQVGRKTSLGPQLSCAGPQGIISPQGQHLIDQLSSVLLPSRTLWDRSAGGAALPGAVESVSIL